MVADLLLAPDSMDALRLHPSGSGIPLLFPSPGRIPKGEYEFQGRALVMGGVDIHGHVLHGFAMQRAWRVVETKADDQSASVLSVFSSDDHPDTLVGYPFPYRVEAAYRLDATGLRLDTTVTNTGSGPMPFGYGVHPYFRIPFTDAGRRENCRVFIPAASRWNMSVIGDLKSRNQLTDDEMFLPVERGLDYRSGVPLADRLLDDVLTGLPDTHGWTECSVVDPVARLAAVMRATANFPTSVVYTPPNRPGLCFEPWTSPPDAFNLAARGVKRSGVIVLAPGRRWTGAMHLSVRKA